MSVKFIDCDGYTNYVAETDNGAVIGSIDIENGKPCLNNLGIPEVEQILTKMRSLQNEDNYYRSKPNLMGILLFRSNENGRN